MLAHVLVGESVRAGGDPLLVDGGHRSDVERTPFDVHAPVRPVADLAEPAGFWPAIAADEDPIAVVDHDPDDGPVDRTRRRRGLDLDLVFRSEQLEVGRREGGVHGSRCGARFNGRCHAS